MMDITVVGLGYVGAVAAVGLAWEGHRVLGVDADRSKLDVLRRGELPMHEPHCDPLFQRTLDDGSLRFSHPDEVRASELGEVIFVAVGTPLSGDGGLDLSQVLAVLEWLVGLRPEGRTVAVKSTVPPGTGRRLMAGPLRGSGLGYVANPEFLREGRAIEDWFHPSRVVIGGESPAAVDAVGELYQPLRVPVLRTDTTTAEMIKYASNAFLATKISFINEIALLCERLGADVRAVARGLGHDPRIGQEFLEAGLGWGGSCFPKDVRALDLQASENGCPPELLRAVIAVNNRQRLLPLAVLREVLPSLYGAPVAVLGLAFKAGTDDVREAPALDIIQGLVEEGAEVRAADPIAVGNARRLLPPSVALTSSALEALDGARAAVLVTDWQEFRDLPWERVHDVMLDPRFVFDGRNCLDAGELLSLGFRYRGVGVVPAPVGDRTAALAGSSPRLRKG